MIGLRKICTIALVVAAVLCFADHPTLNTEANVSISFVFPDGTTKSATLTHDEVGAVLKNKPLPKDLYVDTYKIDWWIFGALRKLDIPFQTETKGHRGYWNTTIIKIGKWSNGKAGKWVYYVNGMRSKYHISTQLDSDVKTIKYEYIGSNDVD